MFCPECGCKIEEDALFCPECGTKVAEEMESFKTEMKNHLSEKDTFYAYGLILTNIKLLAEKLCTDVKTITTLLEQFVEIKRSMGISYQLLDAGNYTFRKKNILGISKTIHLNKDSELWDYMEILMDVHNFEMAKNIPESQYLFIIGGDDIIPMPCVRHYVPDCNDDTIDTDILYAYPYGEEMLALLENWGIFRYDQLFYVGRLPIGEDFKIDDLCNYFELDLNNSCGIPMDGAYGQCDPHWKNVSATVATDLIENSYLRNFDGRLSNDFYFRRLILSPMVTIGTVEQVFHKEASLYYYNLHGSSALESRGYYGELMNQKGCVPVLLPEHMRMCKIPNIVVCEACYGARFIGMDKHHSVLLSSLTTSSLAFLGSSRIAWGNVDPKTSGGYSPVMPFFADTMAGAFINALLQGYTVGQAMFLAKGTVLQQDNDGIPNTAATIVEFNLYGDPTLFMDVPDTAKSARKQIDKSACKIKDVPYGCVVEKVGNIKEDTSLSLLEQVREAVNTNIALIHDSVSRHLYAQYGIEPRPTSGIFKLNYINGKKELHFNYKVESQSDIPSVYTVRTTENGEIISVVVTK